MDNTQESCPNGPLNAAQGPIRARLEALVHKQLKAKLMGEGASDADAETVLGMVGSEHPLIDLFMQYGLPFIMQLLQNLLASLIKPTPVPPAPTPVGESGT